MPASLEARRRAVADALRRVAAEPQPRAAASVEHRLDELASRLSAVETTLLEAAWDRPAVAPAVVPAADGCDDELDERVSVPAVPLGEGRLSSVASQALFGH